MIPVVVFGQVGHKANRGGPTVIASRSIELCKKITPAAHPRPLRMIHTHPTTNRRPEHDPDPVADVDITMLQSSPADIAPLTHKSTKPGGARNARNAQPAGQ